MIKIEVRYFNLLALHAGTRHQTVELPESAHLQDLMTAVAKTKSVDFAKLVLPEGKPNTHLRIFLNGALVAGDEMNPGLHDGDKIMLFPAVAGGSSPVPQASSSDVENVPFAGGAAR